MSDQTEDEKIAKIVSLDTDIKKMEVELKKLDSRKTAVINETQELKETVNKSVMEDRKMIAKERQEFESEKAHKENDLLERIKIVESREKQSDKKQKELSDLEEKISAHNTAVLKFEQEKNAVEAIRKNSLEKEHLADLKIKEYEDKLEELQKGK